MRNAMLRYHAGDITLDELQATYRSFTPDASPPPAEQPGAVIHQLDARPGQLNAAGPDDPSIV
jgi:hypothetical protein